MEKQGSAVMRIVAFAVAIAIVLGLASVMFQVTASAESADDLVSQLGTLGNYDCIKFDVSQSVSVSTLLEQHSKFKSSYTYGALFGYKDGKFISFANNSFSVVPSADGSTLNVTFCGVTMYDTWLTGDKPVYDTAVFKFVDYTNKFCATCVATKNGTSTNKGYAALAYTSYADFVNACGDTLYLVYTGTNTVWDTVTANEFRSDIVNNLTDSNYKDFTPKPTGGSDNGRFICFGNYKEYSYDEHLADISTGAVYQRNDYLSSEQTYYTAFMFDDNSCFNWADDRVSSGHIKMYSSTSIAFNYYNASDSVGAVKLRVSKTQMFPMMRESDNAFDITHYLVQHPANKHFSRYVIISEGSLRSVPANSTATFRVNMQGYCNMDWNSYYLCEIVDVQTETVISSAMFVYTGKNSGKFDGSNIKNGNYISVDYEYTDGNNVNDGDLIPDDDGTLPNLPNGVKDETYNPSGNYDLSNLDISDISKSLESSVNSVRVFFNSCWALYPAQIWTIILLGLTLIIILRILGR